MKKALMSITIIMMCFMMVACSASTSKKSEDAEEKVVVEYYENSTVPKIDSVLKNVTKMEATTEYDLYGPYSTQEEAVETIEEYVSVLTEEYGFHSLDYTVAHKLSNGKNTVMCINGTHDGGYAIGVIIGEGES